MGSGQGHRVFVDDGVAAVDLVVLGNVEQLVLKELGAQ
jgi:hypothetical protein